MKYTLKLTKFKKKGHYIMGSVYKRNRQKSRYQIYVLTDELLDMVYTMKNNKKHKYFLIQDMSTYATAIEAHAINVRDIIYRSYTEKSLTKRYEKLYVLAKELRMYIDAREEIQLLLNIIREYYVLRELHLPGKSKAKSKVARRFLTLGSLIRLIIIEIDEHKNKIQRQLNKCVREAIVDGSYTPLEIDKIFMRMNIHTEISVDHVVTENLVENENNEGINANG